MNDPVKLKCRVQRLQYSPVQAREEGKAKFTLEFYGVEDEAKLKALVDSFPSRASLEIEHEFDEFSASTVTVRFE